MEKLKFSGFIKEYGLEKIACKPFIDYKISRINFFERNLILRYLRNGYTISSIMMSPFSLIEGREKENIGGLRILTDGQYIWPSYISYYVANHYELDTSFLNHIRKQCYIVPSIRDSDKKEAEDLFYRYFF